MTTNNHFLQAVPRNLGHFVDKCITSLIHLSRQLIWFKKGWQKVINSFWLGTPFWKHMKRTTTAIFKCFTSFCRCGMPTKGVYFSLLSFDHCSLPSLITFFPHSSFFFLIITLSLVSSFLTFISFVLFFLHILLSTFSQFSSLFFLTSPPPSLCPSESLTHSCRGITIPIGILYVSLLFPSRPFSIFFSFFAKKMCVLFFLY